MFFYFHFKIPNIVYAYSELFELVILRLIKFLTPGIVIFGSWSFESRKLGKEIKTQRGGGGPLQFQVKIEMIELIFHLSN